MTPTQLHPTDLIAVPVLSGATQIKLEDGYIDYYTTGSNYNYIDLPGGRFELLGTCTKSDIDFDVEDHIDESKDFPEYKYGGELHPKETYWCYESKMYWIDCADDSFRSLLTANGLHFENPYNEVRLAEGEDNVMARVLYNQWQTAQNNLVEKLVILKRV